MTVFLDTRKSRKLELLAFDKWARFILHSKYIKKKAEVPGSAVLKLDYSKKAKSSNDRGVGTFFDTCSNLGHILQYNFKNLASHFPRNSNHKNHSLLIFYGTF